MLKYILNEYIEHKAKKIEYNKDVNSSIDSKNMKFEEKLVPIDGVGIDYSQSAGLKKPIDTTESAYCPNGTVQLKPEDIDLNNPTFEDTSDLPYGEKNYENVNRLDVDVNDIWICVNKINEDKDS